MGADEDNDTFSTNLQCSDPSDCNDLRADIYPGAEEKCDFEDNDCDSQIDEGLVVQEAVDISYGIDCSGSMGGYFNSIVDAYSSGQIPSCFAQDIINN